MEGLNIMEESPGLNQCLRIRRFRRDDLESVLIVERECFSESERFDQLTFTYYLRLDSIFLIAEWCDKSVVGYALGFFEDPMTVHLASIAVRPLFRRRGIGERLIEEFESIAREKGAKKIVLEVRVSNVVALNMYRKRGYRVVKRLPRYYGFEDGYYMVKDLF
ncbi:MAG: GNAT family N-acetyltransferase [Thermosphaera sp.]